MNILIAGASGFIGQSLINVLKIEHQITTLGRKKNTIGQDNEKNITSRTWNELNDLDANQFDAVINLCGSNIAAARWTEKIKRELISSRVNTSSELITWIIKCQAKPHFLCANAIGIYGLQDPHDLSAFDENSPIDLNHAQDFLSEVGHQWQKALSPAEQYGMPVTTLRFGVVLKKNGGMLKKLLPSFYLGLGSIVGHGHQCISWVHMDDLVNAIVFLLQKPELTGAFNVTAPNPVTQAQFARELARVLKRPMFITLPAVFIRALFGEMGDALLLKGQRVLPKRLMDAGYSFHYPWLANALTHEL